MPTIGAMGVPTCPHCGAPNLPPHQCVASPSEPLPSDGGLSFSERFRGTQWDTSSRGPGPVGHPASPFTPQVAGQNVPQLERRAGPSVLLIVGALCLVGALVGIGVYAATRPPPIAPPAGAERAPQRTPYRPPTLPPKTTAPGPTLPATLPTQPVASTTRPSFGPLPDNPAGAFAALMLRGDASYLADVEGTVAFGNERGTLSIELKVSGSDSESTWEVNQGRQRALSSAIVKDGRYYLKLIGEPWTLQPTREYLPREPFTEMAPEDWQLLEYVGPDNQGGRSLHLLRAPAFDWQSLSESFSLDPHGAGVEVHELSFEVWVTKSGVPRLAKFSIEATGRAEGVEVDVTYSIGYRITRFGEPVDIEAPQVTDDGGGHSTS